MRVQLGDEFQTSPPPKELEDLIRLDGNCGFGGKGDGGNDEFMVVRKAFRTIKFTTIPGTVSKRTDN